MPTNYQRGKATEDDARDVLKEAGYYVVRSAGSKGTVDLCAVKPGQVLFVQCKRTTRALSTGEWNVLLWAARDSGALPVLAEREPGGPLRWWLLTGPKRRGQRANLPREPWSPDEVAS